VLSARQPSPCSDLILLPCCIVLPCSKDSTSVIACYLELAEKVRSGLAHIDPYFNKLADGMEAWIEIWQTLNPEYEK
jgi:reversibly glycosylated polypeptide/UDP-arabinopyranose mutase